LKLEAARSGLLNTANGPVAAIDRLLAAVLALLVVAGVVAPAPAAVAFLRGAALGAVGDLLVRLRVRCCGPVGSRMAAA